MAVCDMGEAAKPPREYDSKLYGSDKPGVETKTCTTKSPRWTEIDGSNARPESFCESDM